MKPAGLSENIPFNFLRMKPKSSDFKCAGCVVGAAVALTGCASKQVCKTAEPLRPNVIFILADDLGIGDIEPYGQEQIHTPHLKQMQQQGMRFTQCYSGTAVSAPSRCSLLTGLHTGHASVRGNKGVDPEGQVPMPDGTFTMAAMFKEQGYATGCFGKWGLGYPGSSSDPTKVGFDRFFGYNCQTLAHDYYPDHLWNGETRVDLPQNYRQHEVTYSADTIHQTAMQFIRDHADGPFFAFLSYTLPHAELILPHDSVYQSYCEQIPVGDEKPFVTPNPAKKGAYGSTERPLASFASMVTRLDSYVGDVMHLLDSLGIAGQTLLVFTSDNGPHHEGGANPDYFKSYGEYRGVKRDLYEGGIRMPMLMVYPGHVKAGVDNGHVMAFWDMLPTFAELAGYDQPLQTDGLSAVPTLLGKSGQQEHTYLYWELHEQGGKQAVRQGHWKGVRLQVGTDNPVFELYDLDADIHEDHNVASEHPDIALLLQHVMDSCRTESDLFQFGREKFQLGREKKGGQK